MKSLGMSILFFFFLAGFSPETAFTAELSGLWVGTVSVNAVTEAQIPANPEFTEPQPTGSEFFFRLIMHIDDAGQARLLKQVILMWDPDATACEDPVAVPDTACPCDSNNTPCGDYVLLTDDNLIPNFECPDLLGGEPFCRRISTAAYDFDGLALDMTETTPLAVTGDPPAATGELQYTIQLRRDNPTNPFRHKYHPDHDNLDGLGFTLEDKAVLDADGFEAANVCSTAVTPGPPAICQTDADCPSGEICTTNVPVLEVFQIQRDITLTFESGDPYAADPLQTPPGWGYDTVGGKYEEEIKGLHRHPIKVAGIFRLERVNKVAELNPEVTP